MESTLALVKKEQPKKPEESETEYKDRSVEQAYLKLREKKERTEQENEEYRNLQEKYIAFLVVKEGAFAFTITDADLRSAAGRLYRELSAEYGKITPLKHLLLDRLIAAWCMATSYERLFQITKYKVDMTGDDPKLSYTHNVNSMKLMQETRNGIETANDQIIRLAQTLQNLTSPPLQLKVKNAFFAQNQQVNQAASPKDLDKSSEPKKHE